MTNKNLKESCEIGMIGLGVMGRNFLLNLADHGFHVAGYDKDPDKVNALQREAEVREILGASNVQDFIESLRKPRAVMMLVPAGAPVDSVINEITGMLEPGDLIIDGGNSYYKDTDLRSRKLSGKNIYYLGVGISGGEEGARYGPSIMPGGPKESYERVRLMFEAAAAKVNNEPCVTYLGPGSAGHFVKMVHNGIEYSVMQLISETYDLMKRGLNFNDDQLHDVYEEWNKGELNSYLIEITSRIFSKVDKETNRRLIDEILDVARQKCTGMWTSQSAMELQVPTPSIDLAVAMRDLSVFEKQREVAGKVLHRSKKQFNGDKKKFIKQLHSALYAAIIITYAQGMAILSAASDKYEYNLDLESVAGIWRGGCIIRASLLEYIREAFRRTHDLPNLLLDPELSQIVMKNQEHFRQVVCRASELGIPAMGLMVSLGYLDAYRSSWLPANLIQAQRDFFGAHTYERIDAKGTFHTEWLEK